VAGSFMSKAPLHSFPHSAYRCSERERERETPILPANTHTHTHTNPAANHKLRGAALPTEGMVI